MTVLPYYKRYPASFLRGIQNMTVEQIAVYTVLLEVMYDAWETIEIRTPKQRRDLAVMCGLSPRKFGTTLEELIAADKIQQHLSGRLSNRKFEQLAKDRGVITAETPPENGKKPRDNPDDNRVDNEGAGNGNKGLQGKNPSPHARANLEHRTQNIEQDDPKTPPAGSKPALGAQAEQVIESEIQQICRAIGVDLTASTKRHAWPARWVEMRTKHEITVGDMIEAINSFSAQFKGEACTSIGLFKDRAIEKRQARELGDRIAGRVREAKAIEVASISSEQWSTMLGQFIRLGSWDPTTFGPSPLEDGCIVPPTMLDNAERYWIKNGMHPELVRTDAGTEPWAPKRSRSTVREITPFFRSRAK